MVKPISYFRKLYYWTSFSNSLSFNLMMGNLLMLFLAELNASDTNKGFISALAWFSLLCIIPGKFLIRRIGVTKTLSVMWLSRSAAVLPMALAALLAGLGLLSYAGAVLLTILSQISFQLLRGVGIAGNNPLFYHLTDQSNRSRFLINLQIIANVSLVAVLIFSAMVLQSEIPALLSYSLFFFLGWALGSVTGLLYSRQQEPYYNANSANESIVNCIMELWKQKNSRIFVMTYSIACFASSALSGFLILFMRESSSISDSSLLLYSLGGPFGVIILGLLLIPLLDKIGPKPFSQIYIVALMFVSLASMLQGLIRPQYRAFFYIILFMFSTLGVAGISDSLQAYFLNTIYRADSLNLGMVVHLLRGLGGLGLIFGGILLDLLNEFSLSVSVKYNIFFLFCFAALLMSLILAARLEQSGDFGMKRTLKVLLSPREWYGVWLLSSLNRHPLSSREHSMLPQIHRSGARHIVASDYFRRLHAPDLLIREEVLNGLRDIPLTVQMENQLIEHMERSPFTTAAKAASLLGKLQVKQAIPSLRQGIASVDYNLQAEAALALARLNDLPSLPLLRQIMLSSNNQRVVIYTINAIKIMGNLTQDLPNLLNLWQRWLQILQIEREVTLALAALLTCEDNFFPLYFHWCENSPPCWLEQWQRFFNRPKLLLALATAEQEQLLDPTAAWLQNYNFIAQLSGELWSNMDRLQPQLLCSEQQEHLYWQGESGLFLLLFLFLAVTKKK